MLGVNPYDYLKDAMSQLTGTPEAEVKELPPASWAKIRPAATHRAGKQKAAQSDEFFPLSHFLALNRGPFLLRIR